MINHYHSVQLRVKGTGNLNGIIYSLPDRNDVMVSENLVPLNMTTQTSKMPVLLINFKTEKAKIKFYTTEIDEIFDIGKINVYIKPLWASVPQ